MRPEAADLVEAMCSSPLLLKVYEINTLQRAGAVDGILFYLSGESGFQPTLLHGVAGKPLRDHILKEPEFDELWQRPEKTDLRSEDEKKKGDWARDVFADFLLDPEVSDVARVYVLTPIFRNHIGRLVHSQYGPGPCFLRELDEIRTGDLDTIGFVSRALVVFEQLDEMYLWYQDRARIDVPVNRAINIQILSEVEKEAFGLSPAWLDRKEVDIRRAARQRESINGVLDLAFDKTDTSSWREFVREYFGVAVGLYVDIDAEDNASKIARAEQLFQAVPRSEWDFLAHYLITDKAEDFDDEVLAGNLERAKVVVDFFNIVRGDREVFNWHEGDLEAVDFWTEMYKDGDISAEEYLQFARHFHLREEFLGPRLLIDYWAVRFLDGEITQEDLERAGQIALVLSQAEQKFLSAFDQKRHREVSEQLDLYYQGRNLLHLGETVAELLRAGIMPTPPLVNFARRKGDKGMEELDRLREATSNERFDHNNPLQRDLEFTSFLKRGNGTNYEIFGRLPTLEEAEIASPLKASERMEARAAAYEAANLYWFVKDGLDQRRDTVVIGNERFGYRFCIDPLRSELEKLGVSVSRYYVHSMIPKDEHDFEAILPGSFAQYLAQKDYPNVIVVDGSNDSLRSNSPRLPSALVGYLGWFLAFNEALGIEDYLSPSIKAVLTANNSYGRLVDRLRGKGSVSYSIAFWTPQPDSHIYIGGHLVEYRKPTNEGPQLILANPIIIPSIHPDFPGELSKHDPGHFNDPDKKVAGRSELGFTKHGLGFLYGGVSEEEYIKLVQLEIEANLGEMIRKTNPIFATTS